MHGAVVFYGFEVIKGWWRRLVRWFHKFGAKLLLMLTPNLQEPSDKDHPPTYKR